MRECHTTRSLSRPGWRLVRLAPRSPARGGDSSKLMRLWKDANMPHVDDGEMHALLDGAFARDAPAAARIREEIATRAECKERFDEAQALRMRASALLDRALPRAAAPPFESIIERAGTVDAPRPFRFPAGAPLAWAA